MLTKIPATMPIWCRLENTDSRNQNKHMMPRKKPNISPHIISLYVPWIAMQWISKSATVLPRIKVHLLPSGSVSPVLSIHCSSRFLASSVGPSSNVVPCSLWNWVRMFRISSSVNPDSRSRSNPVGGVIWGWFYMWGGFSCKLVVYNKQHTVHFVSWVFLECSQIASNESRLATVALIWLSSLFEQSSPRYTLSASLDLQALCRCVSV